MYTLCPSQSKKIKNKINRHCRPKTVRLHHFRYRPCSALEGFVCLWLLGNSQQFTSQQQATPPRRSVPRNTSSQHENTGKVTPVTPGGMNSFRLSPGDRLRSLGYDTPRVRCRPVDIERSGSVGFALLWGRSDWLARESTNQRPPRRQPLPIRCEAHLSRSSSQLGAGLWKLWRCLRLPGSRRRVTRNTARHGRRSVCQHRLGSGRVQGTQHESGPRSQFHRDTPLGTPRKPHQNLWHFLGVRRGLSKDVLSTVSGMLRKSRNCLGPQFRVMAP